MTTKQSVLLSTLLILLVTVLGISLWNQFPEQMASHWNANDQVDGYTSRFWGVFLLPLMMVGLTAIFFAIPSIDPLKANIKEFRGLFNIFIVLFNLFMAYVHGLTLAWNLGYTEFRFSSALLPAMGLLFILIGFGIRKAKRNFFIGIRTPWTLSSDTVWQKTHQLGGWLFVAAGVFALAGIFFPGASFLLLFIPMMAAAFIPIVYSYLVWRREEKQ